MSSNARGTHREALLDAAKTLLRERGHADITARDLVAASKTNLGSIGYHFGSKDELLNEAAGLALEEWLQEIRRATRVEGDETPEELMFSSLRMVIDDFEAMRPYFLAFIETVARGARSPEIREQLAIHYSKQRARVAEMVSDAFQGALDPEEAQQLASVVIGVCDGLMLQSLVDPEILPTSQDLALLARKGLAGARGQVAHI